MSISPWCNPDPLKFESYNIQHCEKNCRKWVFWVFTEQLLYHIILKRLHWYEVTLVKKCNKPLLQKRETKIFDQKRFMKNLFKVNEKNKSGILRINHIMSKLLTLSKRWIAGKFSSCFHCYIIFWKCLSFSHFTFYIPLEVLYYNWS